ncbi:MAG: DUF357 domain-containing protein [Candidatus Methanomethylophilaceae archaeon]|nr:DUF357 domain-containing protein [Candidatus Methanomethylophilaceae archaeon]
MKNDIVSERMIFTCLDIFDCSKKDVTVIPPEGSMLAPLAQSGLEMVECYRADAANFTKDGDLVTAFAAINYAHAWIGCFQRLGLFGGESGDELFLRLPGSDDEGNRITDEKMAKYLDITTRARKKIRIASPVRSFDRRLALTFLDTSESFFKKAVDYRNDGDYVRAFAAVNYSHAWLDGGARIGLFDVDGDDVLFTLYE